MNLKKLLALGLSLTMATALLAGCGSTNDTSADAGSTGESGDTSAEQVVIYSNADEEAITAMENALDSNGYEGQYVFQTFGTSELGGRLLAAPVLEKGAVTMDETERNAIYARIAQITMYEDPFGAYMNLRKSVYALSDKIEGFAVNPSNTMDLAHVRCRE